MRTHLHTVRIVVRITLDVRSLAIASRASQFPSGALSCRADIGCLTGVPVASDNMLIS